MESVNIFQVKRELCDIVTQFDRLYRLAENGELTDRQIQEMPEVAKLVGYLQDRLNFVSILK